MESTKVDLTAVDHRAEAASLLDSAADFEEYDVPTRQLYALRAIGHALLALNETERAENVISEKSAVAETRLASTVNDAGRIQVLTGRSA